MELTYIEFKTYTLRRRFNISCMNKIINIYVLAHQGGLAPTIPVVNVKYMCVKCEIMNR